MINIMKSLTIALFIFKRELTEEIFKRLLSIQKLGRSVEELASYLRECYTFKII